VLTIDLAGGGTLTGAVTDETEIECGDMAHVSDDGDGPGGGGDDQGDDNDQGDHHQGDDGEDNCDATALTNGATVREAELKAEDGQATFEKIELGG
jgi:hypothetical protein